MHDSVSVSVGPHPSALVPFRFQVGERTLLTVRRNLVTYQYSLADILNDAGPAIPALPSDAEGIIVRSLPAARVGGLRDLAEGALVYVRQEYPRYYMRLDTSYEAYLACFSAKTRSTLKRKVRKFETLSDDGRLDIREYRTVSEMEAFHTLAREVSRKTYQERLLGSGLPDSESHLAEMRRLAAADSVRAWLLFLNGQPVSYLYTPIRDGSVLYDYLGYDPAFASYSPGTVLQLEALERLMAEGGHRLFDFTEGEGAHKKLFATGSVDCADVVVLRATLANAGLIRAHRTFHTLVEAAGRQTERLGLKAKLKRWLRHGGEP